MCQQVISAHWQETQCKDAMEAPQCFMFSWELDERKPLCRLFDKGNLTNCGLNASLTKSNHAGWLENFQPTLGTLMAELPSPESPVVALAESATQEAILVAFKNGTIMRVFASFISFVMALLLLYSLELARPTSRQLQSHFGPFPRNPIPMVLFKWLYIRRLGNCSLQRRMRWFSLIVTVPK